VRDGAVGVQHERATVKDQLILSTNAVQEHQWQTSFAHPRSKYFF
jgi:hypothetical protein